MFIPTAMALYADFIVADAFFNMLLPNLRAGVFVTAVAGVIVVVVIDMAGFTFCCMVPIKTEIFFVIKGCRGPVIHYMAGAAVADNLLMQGVAWIGVTVVTLFYQCRFY